MGKGRHEKPKSEKSKADPMCTTSWHEKGDYPHENHLCGLVPNHPGAHVCRNWYCGSTY